MNARGRHIWLTLVTMLAATAGCGARGDGVILAPADVPAATDRGGAMDAGTPEDRGAVTVTDDGVRPDVGAPADTAGCVPTGAENSAGTCGDRVDNDCDGFSDCTDPGCDPVCSPPMDAGCVSTGAENSAATCMDNVDNDCDGFTDCTDFDCSRNNPAVTLCPDAGSTPPDAGPCVRTGSENTAAACTDGVDNDCDGFRDCRDFDCPTSTCPRDGGTATDRPACDSGGARESTNAECTDGLDNDCDGFTDCRDFSCQTCAATACVVDGRVPARDGGVCVCQGGEGTNAACGDRVDNDCDGFTDCADFDCSRSDGGVVSVCPGDAG